MGLQDILPEERLAARLWPFYLWGVRRLVDPTYLDTFYRTIDEEYGAFARLDRPKDQQAAIASRVAASIRLIAAFSAWYRVASRLIISGFGIGAALGIGTIIVTLALRFHEFIGNIPGTVCALVAPVAALAVARPLVAALPHRWPVDALTLVVAAAAFSTIADLTFRQHFFWTPGLAAASAGVAAYFGFGAITLIVAQVIAQRVTRRKISNYPEQEIIESLCVLLTRIERLGSQWRMPSSRMMIADTLEWIARRFETNLVRSFQQSDSASALTIGLAATERGEAFRAKKTSMALPAEGSAEYLKTFLWAALVNAASNNWDALPRSPVGPTTPTPARALRFISSSAGIVLPLFLALLAALIPLGKGQAEFDVPRNNLVATCVGWSVLSVLAALNPRQFEAQLAAAKTLGELWKNG